MLLDHCGVGLVLRGLGEEFAAPGVEDADGDEEWTGVKADVTVDIADDIRRVTEFGELRTDGFEGFVRVFGGFMGINPFTIKRLTIDDLANQFKTILGLAEKDIHGDAAFGMEGLGEFNIQIPE